VALGREAGEASGPRLYHEVRYEDLVACPDRELEQMCEFLGLPYAEAMLRFHEGKTRVKPGRSSKAQWLPPTAGLRDWREQLAPDDVERIEAAVGDLLVSLRYAPRSDGFILAARERAARVQKTFTRNARSAERALPRDWAC